MANEYPVPSSNAETVAIVTTVGQSVFNYDFIIYRPTQIRVIVRRDNGDEIELDYQSQFTVSGAGNPNGGSVNFIGVDTYVNDEVYIWRDTIIDREKNWQNEGDYKADLVNTEQNDIYMILQELARDLRSGSGSTTRRSALFPLSYKGNNVLPNSDAGKYLAWDDEGGSIINRDGSKWIVGIGAPSTSIGNSGDFYLDGSTGNVYGAKSGNSWGGISANIRGARGIQGIQGIQGVQGIQGIQGVQGEQGPDGAQGPRGFQGVQGIKGDTGDAGPAGPKGDAGAPGIQGEQGVRGPSGADGDAGPAGPKGDKGDKGDQGEQGVRGPNGLDGPQGAQGVQGDPGPQGAQGASFNPDAVGLAADRSNYDGEPEGFSFLDTENGYLYFKRSNTSGDWTSGVAFTAGPQGPVGPRGPQGEQGPIGPQGDEGARGIQGIQGPKGDDGDPGAQGPKGDKGDEGAQGIQGIQGVKGDKGDPGDPGPKGDKGDKGDQGEQGPEGEQGIQGVQGIQGIQGEQGVQGEKGDKGDDANFYESKSLVRLTSIPIDVHYINIIGDEDIYDGKGGLYIDSNNGSTDVVESADGRTWFQVKDVGFNRLRTHLSNSITVKIPSDFPTLQDAINHYGAYSYDPDVTITLEIEAGHRPLTGVKVANGDYGRFLITSAEVRVLLSPSFDNSVSFIDGINARVPVLGTIVNMNSVGARGLLLKDSSIGLILPGCGFIDARVYTLDIHASVVTAIEGIFRGCLGTRNIHVTHGGHAHLLRAEVSNSENSGLYASHGGTIAAYGAKISNTNGYAALEATGASMIDAFQAEITDSLDNAVYARYGSNINITQATITRSKVAINTFSGAVVSAQQAVISDTETAFSATSSSVVDAPGSTVTVCSQRAIIASYGSTVNTRDSSLNCNGSEAIFANYMGRIDVSGCTLTGAFDYGLRARRASTIDANGLVATGASVNGANAMECSVINAVAAKLRKGSSDASTDIVVSSGGTISCSGSTSGGTSVTPNTITADGIIFK